MVRNADVRRVGVEAAWLTVSRFNWLSSALAATASGEHGSEHPRVALVPTERVVEAGRVIKDSSEIARLREAARRLSSVGLKLAGFVREGRSERSIAGDIEAAIRAAGFERPAFETIVASGANSARPHARPGDRDHLSLATGWCWTSGASTTDTAWISRGRCTWAYRNRRWLESAAAVREAHAAAIAAVRPGARPSEIDAAARRRARGATGWRRRSATARGTASASKSTRIRGFPGCPSALPDTPVAAGMVFTIEPGAYVEGLGGVRIEDDVLVVEDGCEVLTDVPINV